MGMIRRLFCLVVLMVTTQAGFAQDRPVLYILPADKEVVKLLEPVTKPLEADLHIRVEIKAPVDILDAASFKPDRQQYDASILLDELQGRFGSLYKQHKSIFVAVMNQDMYPSEFGWNYVFGFYKKSSNVQAAILSTARMVQRFYDDVDEVDEIDYQNIRNDRLAKMLTRYVCTQLFEQDFIEKDDSVLRPSIMSTQDLDEITTNCRGDTKWRKGPFAPYTGAQP